MYSFLACGGASAGPRRVMDGTASRDFGFVSENETENLRFLWVERA